MSLLRCDSGDEGGVSVGNRSLLLLLVVVVFATNRSSIA